MTLAGSWSVVRGAWLQCVVWCVWGCVVGGVIVCGVLCLCWCVDWCVCWCAMCVVCGVWSVTRLGTRPCVRSGRLRPERTLGGVLNPHTRGSSPVLLTKKSPRRVLTCPKEVHQRNPWIFHILRLRIGRTRHVPDSSNHSPYLMKLLRSSYPTL